MQAAKTNPAPRFEYPAKTSGRVARRVSRKDAKYEKDGEV